MKRQVKLTAFNLKGWDAPPENPELHQGEIHIWRVHLDEMVPQIAEFRHFLNLSEKRRADRFHFQHDQAHFTVGRGMLRLILSRYLATDPRSLDFDYNQYGKPALAKKLQSRIQFNVSHSHGIALIAVTLDAEIGVDVEWIRPEFAELKIANRFFSPEEVQALKRLPESAQKGGFFNCWTRKEAFIKAKGKGLSLPLNQFVVSLDPKNPAKLLKTAWDPTEVSQWSLYALPIDKQFRAALAVEGQQHEILCWIWQQTDRFPNSF